MPILISKYKEYWCAVINSLIKDKRFLKFVFVGIINTIFGYSLYALLLVFNFHYTLAVLFSTIIGVLFNFKTTGKLVFKCSENKFILKFILVYAVVYIINTLIIKISTGYGFNFYWGGIFSLLFTVPISFLLNSEFVFRGKYETN
jgi:putative flippase GtrA